MFLPIPRRPLGAAPLALLLAGCPGGGSGSLDADRDGFASPEDCDDGDASTFPGSHAPEVPADGKDPDCDGLDACRDLNCDGWPDLVFPQTMDQETYLIESAVFLGSPDGYDPVERLLLPTTGAMGAAVHDLDGDGYLDIAFANVSDGKVRAVASRVYWGGPAGHGLDRVTDLPTVGCSHVTAADVDGDGFPDLVFSNRWDGETYEIDSVIYWGAATGFDPDRRTGIETEGASHSAVVDVDDDGWNDLVFANGSLFTDASYVYPGGAVGFDASTRVSLPTFAAEGVTAADVDQDGWVDLLFSQWCLPEGCEEDSWLYWGSAEGFSPANRQGLPARGATDSAVGDLDGDGWNDVVLSGGAFDADRSHVYYGSAAGFSEATRVDVPSVSASGCAIGDLDEDGHPDVVVSSFYAAKGADEVSQIFWGSGQGIDGARRQDLPTTGAAAVVLVGAD